MGKRAPSVADATALRRVAVEAGRSEPPAIMRPERRTVLVNVKVSKGLAIALADRAEADGVPWRLPACRSIRSIWRTVHLVGGEQHE